MASSLHDEAPAGLRGLRTAAPLRRVLRRQAEADPLESPRSSDRGSIAATIVLVVVVVGLVSLFNFGIHALMTALIVVATRRTARRTDHLHAFLRLIALLSVACDGPTEPSEIATPPPLTECHWLGLAAPDTLPVSQTATVSVFRQFCRPNFFPLRNDQVTWTSFTPGVAAVSPGVISAVSRGAARLSEWWNIRQ